MDLSKSPALSRCSLPCSSRQVMVKGRSSGVHRVAALQSRTMTLRSSDRNRAVGLTVTGRAGARTSSPRPALSIVKTVEVTRPDRSTALSTCNQLISDPWPLECVRGPTASRSRSSTACSSARRGKAGRGDGRACCHSAAPPPAATPSTKARRTTAGCRHRVGTLWNNGGREGPTCSTSVDCCPVGSPGSRTIRPYARRASRDCVADMVGSRRSGDRAATGPPHAVRHLAQR